MEERVRAALRLRPEAADEDRSLRVDAACDGADAGGGARSVVVPARDGRGHVTHALDCVFGEGASQASVFAWCAPAVADVALRGVHATIFAYGQTGTGKTHTMLGEGPADGPQAGVIPRAAKALFEALKGKKSVVHASYLQIYGDKVSDMLAGGSAALQVREAPDGAAQRVFVQGLSEYRVASAADVLALVARGGRARATRATDRNASSSRSHAVLQLSLEVEDASTADRTVLRRAKLSLVDLAGSEKWTDAAAKDDALAGELRAINASLAALGNCIAALADHAGKPRRDGRAHVPYRDSVLTRLLQDALGGGTRAVVIATASASRRAEAETSSTLAFAQRATRVTARLRFDEVVSDTLLLKRAQREIERLRRQLAASQQGPWELSPKRALPSPLPDSAPGAEASGAGAMLGAAAERAVAARVAMALAEACAAADARADAAERAAGGLVVKLQRLEDRCDDLEAQCGRAKAEAMRLGKLLPQPQPAAPQPGPPAAPRPPLTAADFFEGFGATTRPAGSAGTPVSSDDSDGGAGAAGRRRRSGTPGGNSSARSSARSSRSSRSSRRADTTSSHAAREALDSDASDAGDLTALDGQLSSDRHLVHHSQPFPSASQRLRFGGDGDAPSDDARPSSIDDASSAQRTRRRRPSHEDGAAPGASGGDGAARVTEPPAFRAAAVAAAAAAAAEEEGAAEAPSAAQQVARDADESGKRQGPRLLEDDADGRELYGAGDPESTSSSRGRGSDDGRGDISDDQISDDAAAAGSAAEGEPRSAAASRGAASPGGRGGGASRSDEGEATAVVGQSPGSSAPATTSEDDAGARVVTQPGNNAYDDILDMERDDDGAREEGVREDRPETSESAQWEPEPNDPGLDADEPFSGRVATPGALDDVFEAASHTFSARFDERGETPASLGGAAAQLPTWWPPPVDTVSPGAASPAPACERHGLTACFLCALQADGGARALLDKRAGDAPVSGAFRSPAPVAAAATAQYCDRHGLSDCFLCSLQRGPQTLARGTPGSFFPAFDAGDASTTPHREMFPTPQREVFPTSQSLLSERPPAGALRLAPLASAFGDDDGFDDDASDGDVEPRVDVRSPGMLRAHEAVRRALAIEQAEARREPDAWRAGHQKRAVPADRAAPPRHEAPTKVVSAYGASAAPRPQKRAPSRITYADGDAAPPAPAAAAPSGRAPPRHRLDKLAPPAARPPRPTPAPAKPPPPAKPPRAREAHPYGAPVPKPAAPRARASPARGDGPRWSADAPPQQASPGGAPSPGDALRAAKSALRKSALRKKNSMSDMRFEID